MFDLSKLFGGTKEKTLSLDEAAELLKTSPDALKEFEKAYEKVPIDEKRNFFSKSSKQAVEELHKRYKNMDEDEVANIVKERIIDELLSETSIYHYKNGEGQYKPAAGLPDKEKAVTKEEIGLFPEDNRPQATGYLQKRDFDVNASSMVLAMLKDSLNETLPEKRRRLAYNMFRQGLDIQDIDPIMYEILGCNKNSMGYWLPKIADAVSLDGFFKIPETWIMKVPMNVLQLTRLDYTTLTQTTRDIVNALCIRSMRLDENKDYFVKTGTFSSKFNFRNAHIHGAKEVREIGEYLLFIQNQACEMAGPLTQPSIYGVSTTNEWVVREFIQDKEENPHIYEGLPLHTEYRVFVDFDTDEVLGITSYWDPEMMKSRFEDGANHGFVNDKHDYVIYKSHEDVLMTRYNENKDFVSACIKNILPNVDMEGQWSIDIMQNGSDFWLIDMALAESSALYNKTVPAQKRRPLKEDWLPKIAITR